MEFTLYYDGLLTSNANRERKHQIRKHFHEQLAELWEQEPLVENKSGLLTPERGEPALLPIHIKSFEFAPLVHSKLKVVADLSITMLLPGPPGQIVRRGGDIDNRLKTLLDALSVPDSNQTPDAPPDAGETPFFYCLLEDDKLITGLGVRTDRLLKAGAHSDEVKLLIHVRTKRTFETIANMFLGI